MRYKFHILAIVVALTLLCSSCYLRPSDSPPWKEPSTRISEMVYQDLSDTTYSYKLGFEYWDILSEQGRMFYDAMWNFHFNTNGSEQSKLYQFTPASDFDYNVYIETVTLFYLDHPEKELLSLWNMSMSYYSAEKDYCNWGLCSLTSEEEYQKKLDEIKSECFQLICRVKQEPIKREKYHIIHDWLVSKVKYDYDTCDKIFYPESKKEKNPDSSNLYGAIVQKLAVCDGISDAFKYLCNQCELECISIRGTFPELSSVNNIPVAHQWNLVYDDKWYLVDCTFDIGTENNQKFFMADLLVDDRVPCYNLDEYLKR